MYKKKTIVGLLLSAFLNTVYADANSLWDALKSGSPTVQLRLRYEGVSDDTFTTTAGDKDVEDLSLRTAIGYKTDSYRGFSAYAQLEDISILNDNDTKSADTRDSGINQAFAKYVQGGFEAIAGRQTIIYDNARHIGNVGWRQNDQTFDAFTLKYNRNKLSLNYSYVWQANRSVGTQAHMSTHLFNGSYAFPGLKATIYSHLIDYDSDAQGFFTDANDINTYGIRLKGSTPVGNAKILYTLEYATQSDGADATASFNADYTLAELGASFGSAIIKVGYELLGTDNGSSFTTPLATAHAHNGWSDKNIATQLRSNTNGIEDTYGAISYKFSSVSLLGVYHNISPKSGTATFEGSEIDLVATYKTKKGFVFGFKGAFFAADAETNNLDKLWLWTEYKI